MGSHLVARRRLEIVAGDAATASRLADRAAGIADALAAVIARCLDAADDGRRRRLDRLELVLPDCDPARFEDDLAAGLAGALGASLPPVLGRTPATDPVDDALDIVAAFVGSGSLPWWASADAVPAAVAAIVASSDPRATEDLRFLLLRDDAVARLVRAVPDALLAGLVSRLADRPADTIAAGLRGRVAAMAGSDPVVAARRAWVAMLRDAVRPAAAPARDGSGQEGAERLGAMSSGGLDEAQGRAPLSPVPGYRDVAPSAGQRDAASAAGDMVAARPAGERPISVPATGAAPTGAASTAAATVAAATRAVDAVAARAAAPEAYDAARARSRAGGERHAIAIGPRASPAAGADVRLGTERGDGLGSMTAGDDAPMASEGGPARRAGTSTAKPGPVHAGADRALSHSSSDSDRAWRAADRAASHLSAGYEPAVASEIFGVPRVPRPRSANHGPDDVPATSPAADHHAGRGPASGRAAARGDRAPVPTPPGRAAPTSDTSTSPGRREGGRAGGSVRWAHDALHLDGAGVVLLAPFLPGWFVGLGLVDAGHRFVGEGARHRAAALIDHLATGDHDPPEPRLPLAKLLAGSAIDAQHDPGPPLSDVEAASADVLLAAAIAALPGFGRLGPATLRATWLRRPGRLAVEHGGWSLRIERQTRDILLARVPWPIDRVALPWMPEPVRVEW